MRNSIVIDSIVEATSWQRKNTKMTNTSNVVPLNRGDGHSAPSTENRSDGPDSREIARMIVDLVARGKGDIALKHLREGTSLEVRYGIVQRIKESIETTGNNPSVALEVFLNDAFPPSDMTNFFARKFPNEDATKRGGAEKIRLLYENRHP